VLLGGASTGPPQQYNEKYPHYPVQSSIYSLLVSAMNMSVRYEQRPGGRERQQALKALIADYEITCDQSQKAYSNANKKP